jgi:uncharacterized SAM-binding protein YcdF (DUF218 family)
MVVLVVVLFVGATVRLFVWSPIDRPTRVDAVVALGGDPGQHRAQAAVKLARSGYAPVAVISLGGYKAVCPHPVRKVRIICFRPRPVNTRGEAEYVSRLVSRRHWDRLMIVSGRSQTTRARLLFKRCTDAEIEMVPVSDPQSRLLYDVAYEWAALVKALVFVRSC